MTGTRLASAPSWTQAIDASDFNGLEGWTVSAVTTVSDDEYEGCDFDKRIHFENGWTLRCSTYSYNYAYRPEAVIFTKLVEFGGRSVWMVKALIEDEIYDMAPVPAKTSIAPKSHDAPPAELQKKAPERRACKLPQDCWTGEICVIQLSESVGICKTSWD